MIANFVYKDTLHSIILPSKVSGQYSFTDSNGQYIIRIEAVDNKWVLKSNPQYTIRTRNAASESGSEIVMGEVLPRMLFSIKDNYSPSDRIYLFTEEYTENRIEFYLFTIPSSFIVSIGSGKKPKTIMYDNEYVSSDHATLQYSNGQWTIQDDNSKNGTFVNGKQAASATLKYGDMVFIMGLKLILGKGCIAVNNPDRKVKFTSSEFKVVNVPDIGEDTSDEVEPEENYFDRSPRFKKDIVDVEMPIDSPPRENNQDEMPIILTVGPAMTMAMASMTTD